MEENLTTVTYSTVPTVQISGEAIKAYETYTAMKAQFKADKKTIDTAKETLKKCLGTAESGKTLVDLEGKPIIICNVSTSEEKVFDEKGFQKDFPDEYEAYCNTSSKTHTEYKFQV